MRSVQRNARRTLANRTKTGLTLSAAVSGLLPLLFHSGTANAATTLTWDPGNNAPGAASGGSGNWDLSTTSDWENSSNADVTWGDATGGTNTADFTAPGGTVTLNSTLGAQEAIFAASGYTFSQGGTNTLTLDGTVKNSVILDASTAAPVGNTVVFNVPVNLISSSSNLQTSGTVTFNGAVTIGSGTPIFGGNTLGSLNSIPGADYTDPPATYVFSAGILGGFEIGGGNNAPTYTDPALAVWNDPTVTDPFGGTGSTSKVLTISYNGSLQANYNLNINGEVSLSGGSPNGMGDLSVHSTTITGVGNISIGANSAVASLSTDEIAGSPDIALLNANVNNFLINNSTGTLTIGSASTVIPLDSAQNGRGLTFSGSGTTVIDSPIEDSNFALTNISYTNSNIAKAGTGMLEINSTGSVYKGTTQVENGTLQLGATNALPTGAFTGVGSGGTPGAVMFGAVNGLTGTLDLNGNSQTVTSISLAQTNSTLSSALAWSFSAESPFVAFTGVNIPTTGLAVGETVTVTTGGFEFGNGTNSATIVAINDEGKSAATAEIALSSDAVATTAGATVTLSTTGAAGGVIGNSSTTSDATLTVNTEANTNPQWNTYGGVIQDTLGSGTHKMNLIVGGTSSLVLTGNNTYTGSTTVSGGPTLAVVGGALGPTNTLVDSVSTLALSNATLSYDLLSSGLTSTITDNGTLTVAGTNIIKVFSTDVSLTPGVYTLISDPNGFTDTPSSFEFSNLTTTETLTVGGTPYTLTLTDPSTAVTLSVAAVPEPASMALVGIAGLGLLRRRKRA